jgi:hypothetical protein
MLEVVLVRLSLGLLRMDKVKPEQRIFPDDFGITMGGRGSGRRTGSSSSKVEDYLAIDLAWLRRRGCLKPGTSGCLTWSVATTKTGSVRYRMEATGFRLIYRIRQTDESWRSVDELIPFMATRNGFGGYRRWFRCLSCSCPCRVIYAGGHFRCCPCHGLIYQSQYERPFTRATNRAQKLRDRLGKSDAIDDPFPPKPKGMHWRTYRRLEALDNEGLPTLTSRRHRATLARLSPEPKSVAWVESRAGPSDGQRPRPARTRNQSEDQKYRSCGHGMKPGTLFILDRLSRSKAEPTVTDGPAKDRAETHVVAIHPDRESRRL